MRETAYTHTTAAGQRHYLHGKTVTHPDGQRRAVYWFAQRLALGAALDAMPSGYRVVESAVTGRPYLRKLPAKTTS
jgi:hypothetical protein